MRLARWMHAVRSRAIPAVTASGERRPHSERGAALVEFALVLPIVTSLVLGMVSGGTAYHRKITMTDAIREGARFGATSDDSAAFATAARDRALQLSSGELTEDNICVQLVRAGSPETVARSWYPGGGSACPSEFGGAPPTPTVPDAYCVVKVWAHRTADLQAVFFNTDVHLKAKAVAAYERGATPGVC